MSLNLDEDGADSPHHLGGAHSPPVLVFGRQLPRTCKVLRNPCRAGFHRVQTRRIPDLPEFVEWINRKRHFGATMREEVEELHSGSD